MSQAPSRFTRRGFGRFASLIAAGGILSEHSLAQLSAIGPVPAGAVRINANENPLGPCAEALEAMHAVIQDGGRYHFHEGGNLERMLAEREGLRSGYVRAYAGSSDPLHRAVQAFTSPSKAFVSAAPGYEAGAFGAQGLGARAVEVPLTRTYAHDVRAMVKADSNPGLIYVCNPNNPTGTVTPRGDLEWLIDNKPAGCVVLVDEAYIHFSSKAVSCLDLVAKDKDLVVLRTFSKLYGMAGIRAGAAFARPDLLEKLGLYGPGMLPVAGMVGAQASLRVKDLVSERRKINAGIRDEVLAFLDKHRFSFVPSESNKFMVDVRQPGGVMVRALAAEGVFVGRVWPSWPTHIRVSVGTRAEMERFQTALLKVVRA